MPKAHRAEGTSLLPTGKNIASSLLQGVPSGRLPHVVCFVFDQSIVASDNRLSYACILLFPKSTKVSFGVPVFPLAMTKSALHGKTQAFASNRRTPTLRLGSLPLETDSFNSGTGEFTRKVERQRVAVQGDSPRKFICAEDVDG